MGGIPFYLKQLSPRLTYSQNIDTIFFKERGLLWDEFQCLYETFFEESEAYTRIVRALQKKRIGLTRNEIVKETKMSNNGLLGDYLTDSFFENYCGFVWSCPEFVLPLQRDLRNADIYLLIKTI